jgi:hypothetical protein
MNCQEVQERLSEYLEQSLDGESMKSVEIHLSACRSCRAEADSLLLCIQNVANLLRVEPPLGFAQRVMAHVRDLERKPNLWERVWFPLRIKMPIHATAIVLIGVLAVYVVEKAEFRRDLPTTADRVASAKREPAQPEAPANFLPETKQSMPPASAPSTPLSIPSTNEESGADRARRSEEKKLPSRSSRETAAPAQSPNKADSSQMETRPLFEEGHGGSSQSMLPIDPRTRARGVIAGTPVANPSFPRIGAGLFSPPSELEPELARTGSLLPLADYELVIRRRAASHDQPSGTPRKRSEAPAEREQPTSVGVERLMTMIPDSPRPQTVWVSLAANQLQQFKKDLVSLGTIESEAATSFRDLDFATKTESEIVLKLTILPPSETGRTAAPSSR